MIFREFCSSSRRLFKSVLKTGDNSRTMVVKFTAQVVYGNNRGELKVESLRLEEWDARFIPENGGVISVMSRSTGHEALYDLVHKMHVG